MNRNPKKALIARHSRWIRALLVGEGSWVAVLGLPETATIREVKEAYKVLIKQNHPDRVHDMSPAFKTLAESRNQKDQCGLSASFARRSYALIATWRRSRKMKAEPGGVRHS